MIQSHSKSVIFVNVLLRFDWDLRELDSTHQDKNVHLVNFTKSVAYA